MTVLAVENLETHIDTRVGVVRAVAGVSFGVDAGKVLGIVGESGSGKSMTAFSIMGLIDPPARVVAGRVLLDGTDLLGLEEEAMRALRGDRIAMVFQDPMMTLNPVLRVDTQMVETVLAHRPASRARARDIARDALGRVGIPDPEERLSAYPHQLSGGMRQRVAIAIALINSPRVVIADEPTTALDVTVQAQILHEVQKLARGTGTAFIWITHDLSVIAGLADTLCVMYAGRIVESGPAGELLDRPLHPYTAGLIESVPGRNRRGKALYQIPGMAPSLLDVPPGCAFRERCAHASPACVVPPVLSRPTAARTLRCFHPLAQSLPVASAT